MAWVNNIFELIKELERARLLAEKIDDEMILYMIDMAIEEATDKAKLFKDNIDEFNKKREPLLPVTSEFTRRLSLQPIGMCRSKSSRRS